MKNPTLPSGVPDHSSLRLSKPAKHKAVSYCFRSLPLHHLLHTYLPAAGTAHCAAVKDVRVHTVIPVDFRIIQRNVCVGVGLFCTPGWSHRHTLSASPAISHFLYHTLFFLSSHFHSHTVFVLLWSSCCPLPLWFLPCWLFC